MKWKRSTTSSTHDHRQRGDENGSTADIDLEDLEDLDDLEDLEDLEHASEETVDRTNGYFEDRN